jgi:formamidopyrimidine-DNA glycosylase
MPELPEVETTKAGITPHLVGKSIQKTIIRNKKLRWNIPDSLPQSVYSKEILAVSRRAKYIFVEYFHGAMMIHLGMSGSLRITSEDEEFKKHDHVIFLLDSNISMRFHDPRRFGSVLWLDKDLDGKLQSHPLLDNLGPEPLSENFTPAYLHNRSAGKKKTIKSLIMSNDIVVGVGNIYANEALFLSNIHPNKPAGSLTKPKATLLANNIKIVLEKAIQQGGTTLKDFVNGNGEPGYFAQELNVYDRENQPCNTCQHLIKKTITNQRATYFCPFCQK